MSCCPAPSVLFICVKNGGKSQLAAALMRHHAGDAVTVFSAGTKPGDKLNAQAVASLQEIGVGVGDEHPKPLDADVLSAVTRVVVLGTEAVVEPVDGMAGTIETWETDEPSARGIEGAERMQLVRDDIDARVKKLLAELTTDDDAEALCGGLPAPQVEVFEPALCCNTGVCGPEMPPELVTFTADLDYVTGKGGQAVRHNLANDPQAFTKHDAVVGFLKTAGSEGLPLVLVNGVTVMTGRYPTRAELARFAGVEMDAADAQPAGSMNLLAANNDCSDEEGCC